MSDVNSLVLCRDHYNSDEEFKKAIGTAIYLLAESEYIATVKYDDSGLKILSINYNYADQSYGCKYPYWLTPEESESVVYEKSEISSL